MIEPPKLNTPARQHYDLLSLEHLHQQLLGFTTLNPVEVGGEVEVMRRLRRALDELKVVSGTREFSLRFALIQKWILDRSRCGSGDMSDVGGDRHHDEIMMMTSSHDGHGVSYYIPSVPMSFKPFDPAPPTSSDGQEDVAMVLMMDGSTSAGVGVEMYLVDDGMNVDTSDSCFGGGGVCPKNLTSRNTSNVSYEISVSPKARSSNIKTTKTKLRTSPTTRTTRITKGPERCKVKAPISVISAYHDGYTCQVATSDSDFDDLSDSMSDMSEQSSKRMTRSQRRSVWMSASRTLADEEEEMLMMQRKQE